jgi:hypothetical protein
MPAFVALLCLKCILSISEKLPVLNASIQYITGNLYMQQFNQETITIAGKSQSFTE